MTDRLRWTDDRLDDHFVRLHERIRAVEQVPDRITRVEATMKAVREDVAEVKDGIGSVSEHLAAQAREHREEQRDREKERSADRRWLIGSSFTAAGLVISAVALLGDKL